MKYTKIPVDAFKKLQVNAGVAAADFKPDTGEMKREDILGMTTGGLTFQAVVNTRDRAENFDNVPKNTKEFLEITDRTVTASTTFVSIDERLTALLNAAMDVDGEKFTPRDKLKDTDFKDLWIIGDYTDENDENNGGYIAIHMMNVLSTGGFQMKTKDKGNGEFAAVFTAHYTEKNMELVPYEMYIHKGAAAA